VVNIYVFVLEFECEICGAGLLICYSNGLRASGVARTAVGLACGVYRGNKVRIHNFGGKLLGRPEREWGDNSKMVVREIGF
jgi:hypothetical protein